MPKKFVGLCIIVVFSIVTFGSITPSFAQTPTQPTTEEMRKVLSRKEFLALVEKLISAGRLDEAEALNERLPDKGPLAFDKAFIAARIERLRGDHATAEKIYRQYKEGFLTDDELKNQE